MDAALREQRLARVDALVNALATGTHDHPNADLAARDSRVLTQGRVLPRDPLAS